MKISHLVIIVSGLAILGISVVQSLPRLAAEQATPCKTCHLNPSGGGMRTEFGNHAIAFNERCLPSSKKRFAKSYQSPKISKSLQVGFDARYLIFDDGRTFRMQTDFFAALEPMKDIFYQVRFGEAGISEHFALLYFDSKEYWIKFGRFTPTFGLRNADHKMYHRERIGLGSNVYLDGISIGGAVGPAYITAELFNPDERASGYLQAQLVGYRNSLSYLAGTSLRLTEKVNGSTGGYPPVASLYGGLSVGRFSWLNEVDLVGDQSDTLAFYSSLTARIEYGLHLIAEYSFFDADRNRSDGVDEFIRASVELFPIPFVQLRPSFTRYTRGRMVGENDYFLQLYIGY